MLVGTGPSVREEGQQAMTTTVEELESGAMRGTTESGTTESGTTERRAAPVPSSPLRGAYGARKWVGVLAVVVRQGSRQVARQVARHGLEIFTALVRYATNHVIAHIPSYTVRHAWYRLVWGWQIGQGAGVLMGQRLVTGGLRWGRGLVTIGEDSVINHGCLIMPFLPIYIGNHVSISAGVSLVTGGHDIDDPSFSPYAAPITIEDYVWIGMNATVLGGVTIGKGAVVATGALVAKDVPPFTVVAGAPARAVKRRKLENPAYRLDFRPLFE